VASLAGVINKILYLFVISHCLFHVIFDFKFMEELTLRALSNSFSTGLLFPLNFPQIDVLFTSIIVGGIVFL
jgi:hypothetical protein